MKKIRKRKPDALQLKGEKELDTHPRHFAPIKVKDIRSAKRLLRRVVIDLQTGSIASQTARDLFYGLTVFMSIVRDFDMMERIRLLEERYDKIQNDKEK